MLDHTDSGLTPTEHRVFNAAIRKKRAYPVLAWPTFSRLQKAGRSDLALPLLTWRDLNEPPSIGAANDNFVDGGVEGGVHVEKFVDQVAMMGEEGEWGFRPGPLEMIRAAKDDGPFPHRRVAVRSVRTNNGWSKVETATRGLVRAPWPQDDYYFYGRLMFGPSRDGESEFTFLGIVKRYRDGSWKRPDGKWNLDRPRDAWRRPRGEDAPEVPAPVVPHYLTPGVVILAGAEFIGAEPFSKMTTPANDNASAEADLVRVIDTAKLRKSLGRDADLLDLATTPLTAEKIGERFGYSGQYARKWAVKAIEDAILRFDALRADMNIPQTRRFAA